MLTRAVETYLAVRRAAGFELRCEGSFLKNFAAFSEARETFRNFCADDLMIMTLWQGRDAEIVAQGPRRP